MIRLANKFDVVQILDIYRPYIENTSISFETIVPSIEEMATRIECVLATTPWLILEENNIILGYAYASKHRERAAYKWSVDVSAYVRQDHRGKGIGKVLYTALLSVLRLQGYCNVYAGICLPNESSVGIHEYFGFKKIANYTKVGYKSGQWHDVGWWELFLEQHNTKPAEPLPLNDIEEQKFLECLVNANYQHSLASHYVQSLCDSKGIPSTAGPAGVAVLRNRGAGICIEQWVTNDDHIKNADWDNDMVNLRFSTMG